MEAFNHSRYNVLFRAFGLLDPIQRINFPDASFPTSPLTGNVLSHSLLVFPKEVISLQIAFIPGFASLSYINFVESSTAERAGLSNSGLYDSNMEGGKVSPSVGRGHERGTLIPTLSTIFFVILTYFVLQRVRVWYRLRHIKGPFWAAFTDFWLISSQWSGRNYLELAKVCDKYGQCLIGD